MEATRKRLEALLQQLEQATATADHTIGQVRAALREMDVARTAAAHRPAARPTVPPKKSTLGRASRKR